VEQTYYSTTFNNTEEHFKYIRPRNRRIFTEEEEGGGGGGRGEGEEGGGGGE